MQSSTPKAAQELSLEPIEDLDGLREDWSALAQASGNLFSTWEWNTLWLEHAEQARTRLFTACRDSGGRLAAIIPLYVAAGGPVRQAKFPGHGPICADTDLPAAMRAMRRLLDATTREWDVFVAHLPGDAEWEQTLGAWVVERAASPAIQIEGKSWNDYLGSVSANFRSQLRRRERRLARERELRFRMTADAATLPTDMDTLFRLHEQRWPGGSYFSRDLAEFQRHFAGVALERGWLRLWLLELSDRPVAAWYGFRYADIDWFYQQGRDPSLNEYSLGFVLLTHTVREAFEDGVDEYRFLRGSEGFKQRFSSSTRETKTALVPTGLRGRAALAAAVARARWRARAGEGR